MSIFYTVFGVSVMMAKSISVLLGTVSVYLVYKLSLKLWDDDSAQKAAWVTALFPTLILYSATTLREPYIVFLLLSLIGIMNFIKNKKVITLVLTIFSFYILSLFHGPVIMGAFVLLFILILDVIKKQLIQIYNMRINFKSILIILALLLPIILYLNSYYSIPYLGNFTELKDINHLLFKANIGLRDDASYPSFLIINDYFELIPKIILKMFYFYIVHLFGMFIKLII